MEGDTPVRAARRNRGRTLLIVGILAAIVLVVAGGGAAIANGSLSSTYSPRQAVFDYFSAMSRGDVSGMTTNATFLAGDSTYAPFFGREGVTAMMKAAAENNQIKDVKVGSPVRVDDSTVALPVTLNWAGSARKMAYKVQKDISRTHFLFYPSWRVEIPFATIGLTLPNQAGVVEVDGIALQASAAGKAEVIQGFHSVTLEASDFYAESTHVADAVASGPQVSFASELSAGAAAAAAASIKGGFANLTCDVDKLFDCPNHQYKVPAGYYDVLPTAGGDITANSSWSLVFVGDPTTNMKLTVAATSGEVDGSGSCGMKLTVDGSHVYDFVGTWTAVLTWRNGSFSSDVLEDCDSSRA